MFVLRDECDNCETCTNCGAKQTPHLICDSCGYDDCDVLYPVDDGDELCTDCLLEKVKEEECDYNIDDEGEETWVYNGETYTDEYALDDKILDDYYEMTVEDYLCT